MAKRSLVTAVLVMGVAFACGGGKNDSSSGLPGSKPIVELSTPEITDLCEYLADIAPAPRTINCPDGSTITITNEPISECVTDFEMDQLENPTCEVTVSQLESCAEAIAVMSDSERCSATFPSSCAPLLSANCT